MHLLIHHHATAFIDDNGKIWLPSFIGRWVDEIANLVDKIGLILHVTTERNLRQDTLLHNTNIELHSLGPPGKIWDGIPRMRRLHQVCATIGLGADILLIRGITPRQWSVWHNTSVNHKAFLLVGSLIENRASFSLTPLGFFLYWRSRWRQRELTVMANQNLRLAANSPLLVKEIEQELGVPAQFIPTNSINQDEFSELNVRSMKFPTQLLFCGRVVPQKGIYELVHALALLNDCELDIIGPYSQQDREQIEVLSNHLGVIERIRWHGILPYGDLLFQFYKRADLFVLPTYHEGFPHVIWEAAANCCPVITTDVDGIRGLWEHNKHGILIEPRSSIAITKAVQTLQNDDSLRERIVTNAHRYAQDFTVEKCANKLVAWLSTAIT